jgi:histidinol-phosphate aminotransferase
MPPKLTSIAESLPPVFPFVGPETQERGTGKPFRARLGANESGFGPSPKVIEAVRAAAPEMWKYCDPSNHDLKVAIASFLGLKPENIGVGEGIDGLQHLICRLYLSPGDTALNSLGGYPAFNYHIDGCGARLLTVPYDPAYRQDLGALLDCVKRERPRIVYVCNPDNPMGTVWPASGVQAFIEAVPEDIMIVLDEAYFEFAPANTTLPANYIRPNLFRTRTFSKAYGLAGIRCGYAIGTPEVIGYLDRIRNHYGVNKLAQVAGVAAVADQDWLQSVVIRNAAARERLYRIAAQNNLKSITSATNFVEMDCDRDGAYALRVLEALRDRGVFLRKPFTESMDHFVRVSTGPDDEIDVFAEELPRALAAAG